VRGGIIGRTVPYRRSNYQRGKILVGFKPDAYARLKSIPTPSRRLFRDCRTPVFPTHDPRRKREWPLAPLDKVWL
jgi:hypothetical protein